MSISLITHDGETLSLAAWSARTGIPVSTIRSRIVKLRWSVAEALTTPLDRRFRGGGRHKSDAPRPCPELKKHPATGLAYCRWSDRGKEQWKYFGEWGTERATAAYRRFAREWAAGDTGDDPPPGGLYVAELVERWLAHCARTYRKRGKITSEVHLNRTALAAVNETYGDTLAADFDAKKLRAAREGMVERGWKRKTVNDHVARVVRMFAWAAAENLAPETVHRTLALLEPLVRGRRDDVAEGEGVDPVPAEHVAAVLAGEHLHPTPARRAVLAAMIRVQLLTGMRPGELCSLTTRDVDRRRTPWRYEVTEYNKMLHKDVTRVVYFGPKAREVLGPLLDAAPQGGRVFRYPPWRKKAGWSPVTTVGYRNRIRMACLSAGVPVWTPNQLRHNKATEVMDRYESDRDAAAVIGNSPEVARQVYAKNPGEPVARRIAEETG